MNLFSGEGRGGQGVTNGEPLFLMCSSTDQNGHNNIHFDVSFKPSPFN